MIRILIKLIVEYAWRYFPILSDRIKWLLNGNILHLNPPRTLNEVIIWLSFKTDTTEWSRLADKYRVREYVKEKGYPEILPKLYGVYHQVDDIIYDELPKEFVLKCNHDCGSYHIIDKSKPYNIKEINRDLSKRLKNKFGALSGEIHYTKIPPCIIAEEYLKNGLKFSTSLVDYKVWCFNGKPSYIWTVYNRSKERLFCDVYDLDWNVHPEYSNFDTHFMSGNGIIPKPKSFDKMIEIASHLSEGFTEVRVDFYDVDGKLYFGEMTFTSGMGQMSYFTEEFQKKLGSLCNISDRIRS